MASLAYLLATVFDFPVARASFHKLNNPLTSSFEISFPGPLVPKIMLFKPMLSSVEEAAPLLVTKAGPAGAKAAADAKDAKKKLPVENFILTPRRAVVG